MIDYMDNPLKIGPTHAWSGSRYIDMLDPKPGDIVLHEVLTGLSREFRYGGAATSVPWSVGQHSLLCLRYARGDGHTGAVLKAIFAHDFTEYMLRDIIAPLKRGLPEFEVIEEMWAGVISTRFGIDFYSAAPLVKHYDLIAAASEKAEFVAEEAGPWPFLRATPRKIPAQMPLMSIQDTYADLKTACAELGIE